MKTSTCALALFLSTMTGQISATEKDSVPATDIAAKRCFAFATALTASHPSNDYEDGRACSVSRTRYPKNATIAYGYAASLWNTEKYSEAMKAAKIAEELGSIDAPVLIGKAYYFGAGVEKDVTQSYRFFMLGLERGSKRAAFFLAESYQFGHGVRRDAALAWRLANIGAENGDPHAIDKVGYFLMEGIGTERNTRLALQFHLKAAELGNSIAMYNAALCFLEREMQCGVQKDSARALTLAKNSAYWGYEQGMRLMGVIYQRGTGVKKDDAIAAEWYRKAIAAGDEDSKGRLHALLNPPVQRYGYTDDRTPAQRAHQEAADALTATQAEALARALNK